VEIVLDFLKTLKLLTALPVPLEDEPLELDKLSPWFPLAGTIIGGLLLLANELSLMLFTERLTAVFVVVFWIFISGGKTIRGITNWAISRSNASPNNEKAGLVETLLYASLLVVVAVLLKSVILSGLRWQFLSKALMLAPLTGAWGLVIGLVPLFMEPAGEECSSSAFFKKALQGKQMIYSSITGIALAFGLGGFTGLVLVLLSGLVMVFLSFHSFRVSGRASFEKACFVSEAGEIILLVLVMVTMRVFIMGY
jgi:hypothetical protein